MSMRDIGKNLQEIALRKTIRRLLHEAPFDREKDFGGVPGDAEDEFMDDIDSGADMSNRYADEAGLPPIDHFDPSSSHAGFGMGTGGAAMHDAQNDADPWEEVDPDDEDLGIDQRASSDVAGGLADEWARMMGELNDESDPEIDEDALY